MGLTQDVDRVGELMHKHVGDADHGHAPVVVLLRLRRLEGSGALGLDSEGVESEVSWDVVLVEITLAGDRVRLRVRSGDRHVLHQGHGEKGKHLELRDNEQRNEDNATMDYNHNNPLSFNSTGTGFLEHSNIR